jgi:hypothetical protein
MTDREKVIKAIQDGIDFFEDRAHGSRFESWIRAQKDALTLLREQEPVAPELQSGGNYVCGACGVYTVGFMHPLTGESVQTWKYCGSCGKKVKWE